MFCHMAGRRQQRVCQRTVVRDQKQSLGVEIQPSHREQISSCGVAQIIHHRAVHIVLCRRHTAGGLVKQIIPQKRYRAGAPRRHTSSPVSSTFVPAFCNRSVHGDQTGFDLFFTSLLVPAPSSVRYLSRRSAIFSPHCLFVSPNVYFPCCSQRYNTIGYGFTESSCPFSSLI